MSQHETLNNVSHKDVKVNTQRLPELGDQVMSTKVYPIEFRHLQSHYPIVFYRDTVSSSVMPVALFGFENDENLFLSDAGWDAGYIPLLIERQPFSIGRGQAGGDSDALVINIDMNHPRVNTAIGESLFLPSGGNSDYIEDIASKLQVIHDGETQLPAFMTALDEANLLEPFFLDIDLGNGKTHRLSGFMTINEEKLSTMNPDTLCHFHQKGWLQHIYMCLASQSQIRTLIAKKQAKM